MSAISDATDDVYSESPNDKDPDADLNDYNRLIHNTQQRLKLLDEKPSTPLEEQKKGVEQSDEFLRNFFIKFGMDSTLECFQQEWFELKAKGKIDIKNLPQIPQIYKRNAELSDELAMLQEELDEARVIANMARSTYDKLMKQKEFQKINHRRVQ